MRMLLLKNLTDTELSFMQNTKLKTLVSLEYNFIRMQNFKEINIHNAKFYDTEIELTKKNIRLDVY